MAQAPDSVPSVKATSMMDSGWRLMLALPTLQPPTKQHNTGGQERKN